MNVNRHRRWFQLSLKSLFLIVLLVATFFGGHSLARRQRDEARDEAAAARVEAQATAEAARVQARAAEAIQSDQHWEKRAREQAAEFHAMISRAEANAKKLNDQLTQQIHDLLARDNEHIQQLALAQREIARLQERLAKNSGR